MKKDTKLVIILLILVLAIILIPLFALKGAEFGGSDDAGSVKVEEIQGEYEPWFTPVFETALGGEIPGEIESLLFCVQTGIGVGIIAFIMGRLVERKKHQSFCVRRNSSDISGIGCNIAGNCQGG